MDSGECADDPPDSRHGPSKQILGHRELDSRAQPPGFVTPLARPGCGLHTCTPGFQGTSQQAWGGGGGRVCTVTTSPLCIRELKHLEEGSVPCHKHWPAAPVYQAVGHEA